MLNIKINSLGAYIPKNKVSSLELENIHGLPLGWIEEHTGIKERPYYSSENMIQAGVWAAQDALKNANLHLEDMDCLLSASASKFQPIPCTASFYKRALGAKHKMGCFDIDSTCLSFVTALDSAICMINSKRYKNILIISSEHASLALNWEQKESAPLFGDLAVAAVVSRAQDTETSKVLSFGFDTFPEGLEFARVRGGTVGLSVKQYREDNKNDFLFDMNGKSIYKVAAKILTNMMEESLSCAGIGMKDIKMVIPHQASMLSMKLIQSKLNIPEEKMMYIIQNYGNNVAASIPLALKIAIDEGKVKRGDKIMLLGTSAGLSVGVMILEY
ncbi:MAG: hypothetical protein LBF13_04875 [Campylobacteraceae bacterium]|jgi:3-oxoacyl-[acyl-carrier-protein] synthase-3|nr:hypothetical protein [Campylobacteraceae bacterium]